MSPSEPGPAGGGSPVLTPQTRPLSRATPGMERLVALALGAMGIVLLLVYVDLVRAEPPPPPPPFDWQNPLLFDQPGDCIEVSDDSNPGPASFLVVRPPGVVLRPFQGPAKLEGWINPSYPDPRGFFPYVACDLRRAPPAGAAPGSLPPQRPDPHVFPLGGFGMPLEALCVLSDIQPATVNWNGQTRHGYAVTLRRYGQLEGSWIVYMSRDAPVLGTTMRRYLAGPTGLHTQSFRVPEDCK